MPGCGTSFASAIGLSSSSSMRNPFRRRGREPTTAQPAPEQAIDEKKAETGSVGESTLFSQNEKDLEKKDLEKQDFEKKDCCCSSKEDAAASTSLKQLEAYGKLVRMQGSFIAKLMDELSKDAPCVPRDPKLVTRAQAINDTLKGLPGSSCNSPALDTALVQKICAEIKAKPEKCPGPVLQHTKNGHTDYTCASCSFSKYHCDDAGIIYVSRHGTTFVKVEGTDFYSWHERQPDAASGDKKPPSRLICPVCETSIESGGINFLCAYMDHLKTHDQFEVRSRWRTRASAHELAPFRGRVKSGRSFPWSFSCREPSCRFFATLDAVDYPDGRIELFRHAERGYRWAIKPDYLLECHEMQEAKAKANDKGSAGVTFVCPMCSHKEKGPEKCALKLFVGHIRSHSLDEILAQWDADSEGSKRYCGEVREQHSGTAALMKAPSST